MANEVYVNGREIAGKASDGKSVAAFPDICLSPPSPPIGPVPIPYPVTAMATDTMDGSTTVLVHGKPVMLKDRSKFKKCTGDEAATRNLGMGIISHNITGASYFQSWSMNVKIEGENAVRHLDIMTHNHASKPGNTIVWPYLSKPTGGDTTDPCAEDRKKEMTACTDYMPYGDKDACVEAGITAKPKTGEDATALKMADKIADPSSKASDCLRARRCQLVPYKPQKGETPDGKKGKTAGCCPGQTGHHLVAASSFFDSGRGGTSKVGGKNGAPVEYRTDLPLKDCENFATDDAPCICAEGASQNDGTHGLLHTATNVRLLKATKGAQEEFLVFDHTAIDLSRPNAWTADDPRRGLIIEKDASGAITAAKKRCFTVTVDQASDVGAQVVGDVFPESACQEACLKAQLDAYHKQKKITPNKKIKSVVTGKHDQKAQDALAANAARRKDLAAKVKKHVVSQMKRAVE